MKRSPLALLVFALLWVAAGSSVAYAQLPLPPAAALVPIANDDTAYTFVNMDVDIDVLANDENTNPTQSPIILLRDFPQEPAHGTAFVDRNGTPAEPEDDFINYDPDLDYIGPDTLIYELSDIFNNTRQATVFIFVNVPPEAVDDTERALPDATSFLDVLANDTDADGDSLIIEAIVTSPMHGMAMAVDSTGRPQLIAYTPDPGFLGEDSLRYALFDGKNGRDSAWVNITINTPPVAEDDTTTTLPGTPVVIDVLGNDADPDGDALSVDAITGGPSNGAAVTNGVVVTYTPQAGFAGTDSFTYAAADPFGATGEATVVVIINTPPTAVDDAAAAIFEMPVVLDVLDNDGDVDGDPLTIDGLPILPDHGTAEIIDSGQRVRYTPEAGYFGPDGFDYAISDGRGGTSQASVAVDVLADAAVQIIHNAAGAGTIDIYADDVRVVDDMAFQTATPFLPIPVGAATIDVTEGGAANNNNPLFSATLNLVPMETYVAVASGVPGTTFGFSVKEGVRLAATVPNLVDFFIAQGVPDATIPGVDVRRLDPFDSNLPAETLAEDLVFGALTDYLSLLPNVFNLDVTNFDNTEQYGVVRLDLNAYVGQTFVLVASGKVDDGTATLIGFDVNGDPVTSSVVTAAEAATELPTAFVLKGNYPNPFNPATTLQFDLPQPAEVTVEVIDVLGRTVMTIPAQSIEAGVNRTLAVDAARLASGAYLYRVIARTAADTMIETGRMTLIK